MKPRISKKHGWWCCEGEIGHYHNKQHGSTPKEAYDAYNKTMTDHILYELNKNAVNKPRK